MEPNSASSGDPNKKLSLGQSRERKPFQGLTSGASRETREQNPTLWIHAPHSKACSAPNDRLPKEARRQFQPQSKFTFSHGSSGSH